MRLLLPLLLMALVACSQPRQPQIVKAWIPAAPGSSQVMAGYLTIRNPGPSAWKLESIDSSAFEAIELHETRHEQGMMQMREIEQLLIPPDSRIEFQAGDRHLMLRRPTRALTDGSQVDLQFTLRDEQGQELLIRVDAEVTSHRNGG